MICKERHCLSNQVIRPLDSSESNCRSWYTPAIKAMRHRLYCTPLKKMVKDHDAGKLATEDITEECFSSYLDTKEIPDPDLLIRTSGEQRLSNYLLWQLAYSEFYFTPVPWPDFSKAELEKAVEAYNQRDRRYGGVKEEA